MRRFRNGDGIAEDLRRFLAGEPIVARPVGRGERLLKWARRRPTLAAVYALLVLVLGLGAGGTGAVWLWQRAAAALEGEQRAKEAEALARQEVWEAKEKLEQVVYLR